MKVYGRNGSKRIVICVNRLSPALKAQYERPFPRIPDKKRAIREDRPFCFVVELKVLANFSVQRT